MSLRARVVLSLLAALAIAAAGAAAWLLLDRVNADDDLETYDFTGPQPGDLSPSITVDDNVRNYGLEHDLRYRFSTNSSGFRGPEARPAGRPVVLVLGDSFAFGMGVDDGETFPDHLRTALETELPNVVVHNAAVPGYTIVDQLEQWRQKLHATAPDVVLVCHTASDLKEMARPTSFRRLMAHDDEVQAAFDAEVQRIIDASGGEKAEATRRHYVFTQDDLLRRLGAGAPPELERLRGRYNAALAELADEVQAKKPAARTALVLWVDGYGMAGLTAARTAAAATEHGIAVFDGQTALLQQRLVGPDDLFLPDKHFSPSGNRIAAQQTAAWLLTKRLVHP